MRWTSALLFLLLLSTGTARAVPLPDVSSSSTVLFNLGARRDSIELGTLSLTDSRFGSVLASVGGTPSAAIIASAHIGPSSTQPGLYGRGVGLLTFYFSVDGPAGTVPVQIGVAGRAQALASDGASFVVQSRWTLYSSPSLTTVLASDSIDSTQITGAFDQSFGRTVNLSLTANNVYALFMLADAEAAATNQGSRAAADAFVDPLFSLGPGVDPGLYSFSFSAGIGNSPVPEPSALALAVVALLSLGGLERVTR